MTVKLNIKAKNLDELGLELREKRKPRKPSQRQLKRQLGIPNIRTPYNLNSFATNQGNIPTINSAIGLETLKAIENKNNNPQIQIDNDYLKKYIDRGLDDIYNRISQSASYMGSALMNEINNNRNMINNFQNMRSFTPSGNRNPPGNNNNKIIVINPEEEYQQVINDVDPFLYGEEQEFNRRDQIQSNLPSNLPITYDEIRERFKFLNETKKDEEEEIKKLQEEFEPKEEEIKEFEPKEEEIKEEKLKDEGIDDIIVPIIDHRDTLKNTIFSGSKPLNKIPGLTQTNLLDMFYSAYPHKNIVVENKQVKIKNKGTDEHNKSFKNAGTGVFSNILKSIQEYVRKKENI